MPRHPPIHRHVFDANLVRFVHAAALRIVRDQDAAADVTQEALIRIFAADHTYRGDATYSTWVYRVAATSALMWLRSRRRQLRDVPADAPTYQRDASDDGMSLLERLPGGPTPEELVASAERASAALHAVDALGAKYGEVFRLRYREGCSETEIARRLGTTLPTVKTRAHRALVAARRAA